MQSKSSGTVATQISLEIPSLLFGPSTPTNRVPQDSNLAGAVVLPHPPNRPVQHLFGRTECNPLKPKAGHVARTFLFFMYLTIMLIWVYSDLEDRSAPSNRTLARNDRDDGGQPSDRGLSIRNAHKSAQSTKQPQSLPTDPKENDAAAEGAKRQSDNMPRRTEDFSIKGASSGAFKSDVTPTVRDPPHSVSRNPVQDDRDTANSRPSTPRSPPRSAPGSTTSGANDADSVPPTAPRSLLARLGPSRGRSFACLSFKTQI